MDPLEQRMKRWQIHEEDLQERFVLGSGSGGQKINKTSSCVYLKHLPTGVEVNCQESRSREKNREMARGRLCDYMERKALEKRRETDRNRAIQRYKKRRPSRRKKAKNRQLKQSRSDKKQLRRRVDD